MIESNKIDLNALIKQAKNKPVPQKKIRLALLGDSATQFLAKALQATAKLNNIDLEILEADYNQIDALVFTKTSKLYGFDPQFIIVYHSVLKLKKRFYGTSIKNKPGFYQSELEKISQLYNSTKENSSAIFIYLNFPFIEDSVYGNYSLKTSHSWKYQLQGINNGLSQIAIKEGSFFICDLVSLAGIIGIKNLIGYQLYVTSDIEYSFDALPLISSSLIDIINAITGTFKKCLILDLDNTLWGGIIGDDGINGIEIGDLGIGKAFSEFQLWIKQLKERGIILAVCSKNNEEIAKEPFQKHPEMILKEEDFALFVANWNNKADNIRYIQSVLNIGFDSMVFIDDNPFERNIVRENLPEVTVPEIPKDPAEYLFYLSSLNLFETASFNLKDTQRTKQYREEAQRKQVQMTFTDQNDYLRSLHMGAKIAPFNEFNIPRVAQLTQRSNQFNFRTIRYNEQDIKQIMLSDKYQTHTISLSDKFGEYGLINLLILEDRVDSFFIDTWIMSCRVLKRGVEDLALNEIVCLAEKFGKKYLIGEYLPTKKNIIIKDLYKNLGFELSGNKWIYPIENHVDKKHFITKKEPTTVIN